MCSSDLIEVVHESDLYPVFTQGDFYGTDVDVLRVRGRVVVVGTPDDQHVHHVDHDH